MACCLEKPIFDRLPHTGRGVGLVLNLVALHLGPEGGLPVWISGVERLLLWDDRGSTSFVLTAIGLGIVIVGVLIVSNVWKTPT